MQIHTRKEIHKNTENDKSFDFDYKSTLNKYTMERKHTNGRNVEKALSHIQTLVDIKQLI